MLWTTVRPASILAADTKVLSKTKTLPASGGEGGPDDREENLGAIRTIGSGCGGGQALTTMP
jgi:hypothetical protein